MKCLALTLLALIACTSLLGEPFYSAPTDFFQKWDEQGYGRISGKVQYLYMYREREDNNREGDSSTTALTLNYLSAEKSGLSFGAQYIYTFRIHEDGNTGNPAYNLLVNDDHQGFNELYLNARLDAWCKELNNTELTVGRQILNYDFAPAYAIRQKSQSFEAIVLKVKEWEDFSFDLGHLERFSSWASRYDGASNLTANFIDVEDRVGVNYKTHGFQFINANYQGLPNTQLSFYDFYGHDMFNTLGLKGSHRWALDGGQQFALKTHYAKQDDVGKMDTSGLGNIDTHNLELAAEYKYKAFTGTLGYNTVGDSDFQVPFRTSFVIDPELLGWTRQFDAKTDSLFAKGTYKHEKWLFSILYVNANRARTSTRTQMDSYEINGIVKYAFNPQFYAIVKAGHGEQRPSGTRTLEANDARLFIGYMF